MQEEVFGELELHSDNPTGACNFSTGESANHDDNDDPNSSGNNIMSEKVQSLANSLYQEFESLIARYNEDVVSNLMPITVAMLDSMNSLYTAKHDCEVELDLLKEDSDQLMRQYEREKVNRKSVEEALMNLEDQFLHEKRILEEKISSLESIVRMLEIKAKNSQDLVSRMEEKDSEIRREYQRLDERYRKLLRSHVERGKTPQLAPAMPHTHTGSQSSTRRASRHSRDEDNIPDCADVLHDDIVLEVDCDYEASIGVDDDAAVCDDADTEDPPEQKNEYSEEDGISREIDIILKENNELIETKNALNIVKTDLIHQLDDITLEKQCLESENKELLDKNEKLVQQSKQMERELREVKQQLSAQISKQRDNDDAESDVPLSQRKRFTRMEMARVLTERNQYKERLLELQEAVKWTEMLRASRDHPDLLPQRKKTSIWNSFIDLLGGGAPMGEDGSTSSQQPVGIPRPVRPPGMPSRMTPPPSSASHGNP